MRAGEACRITERKLRTKAASQHMCSAAALSRDRPTHPRLSGPGPNFRPLDAINGELVLDEDVQSNV